MEVRHDGVDVLADPGTFCYHGQPEWRRYFRSTLGHNTLQVDGGDQSVSGGPFLWTRHARSRVLTADTSDTSDGGTARWCAEHDGYQRSVHRRRVELATAKQELTVVDEVRGPRRDVRLAFHLGPAIARRTWRHRAVLTWARTARRGVRGARPCRAGSSMAGETDPPLGWYSAGSWRGTAQRAPAPPTAPRCWGSSPPCSRLGGRVGIGGRSTGRWRRRWRSPLSAATGCESTPGAPGRPTAVPSISVRPGCAPSPPPARRRARWRSTPRWPVTWLRRPGATPEHHVLASTPQQAPSGSIVLGGVALLHPPSLQRACAIFLISYCAIAFSYTEAGLGDASPRVSAASGPGRLVVGGTHSGDSPLDAELPRRHIRAARRPEVP
ncbi:hypothetical protein SANTM175S_04108 [Streptomyces antimycoticus]